MAEASKSKKRNDLLVIIIVLLLAAVMWLFVQMTADDGTWVIVSRDGQEIARYELGDEQSVNITDASGSNVLLIKDGMADITEADCPDKLCVHQSAINKSGQTIVCLPHKLVISIEGGELAEIDSLAK